MKIPIYMITFLLLTLFLVGCVKEEIEADTEIKYIQSEEFIISESSEEENTESEDIKKTIVIDFTYDYTEDIKADVDYAVSASDSLQEELENINKIIQKYTLLLESALTQVEMNAASQWLFVIWDTELNNLWGRFSNLADQETKEKVLEEQRNWIGMKEEVTLTCLGPQEENGSMYSMLLNSLWEEKPRIELISLQMSWRKL